MHKLRGRIFYDVAAQEYHSDRLVIWPWVKDGAVKKYQNISQDNQFGKFVLTPTQAFVIKN